ncbi:IclR family transcriptional regulator domain-containing protein [Shinella pollutisoli]|uniref:IclR family transcriptional regulator C-terminal domain-containing protein n=1 Tax=Shinella pollutisoli TaxID=2250594 RepID=A0ABV7DM75_9HYPH|nr:IclR family transcriptional regulator C-terminal domain-containing protein [Shinella pollutisoli]
MAIKETDYLGGLAKGLSVIEAFTAETERMSISDASQITGLDRATARRCLLTLHTLGYANYDGKYFSLTPRVLRLGTGCLATMPLPRIVQPWLDTLSAEIGQSVSVSILDGWDIVYVARSAQQRVMSISLMPGSRLPAYCTSMGRVILASLPEEEARAILAMRPLEQRTRMTRTDIEDIVAELRAVKAQGYAIIDQEVEIGLRSIAVPILNARGQTVAALNTGVAALHADPAELRTQYLEPLLALQKNVRPLLK